MSSTHDQENGAKKSPIFNMCSQMSGFCYDSAKEIAVKNFELPTYILDTSQFFVQVRHGTMYAAKVSFFVLCKKMQLITSQNFNIQICFSQFLWYFTSKC